MPRGILWLALQGTGVDLAVLGDKSNGFFVVSLDQIPCAAQAYVVKYGVGGTALRTEWGAKERAVGSGGQVGTGAAPFQRAVRASGAFEVVDVAAEDAIEVVGAVLTVSVEATGGAVAGIVAVGAPADGDGFVASEAQAWVLLVGVNAQAWVLLVGVLAWVLVWRWRHNLRRLGQSSPRDWKPGGSIGVKRSGEVEGERERAERRG